VALRTRWPLVAAVLLFATLASLLEPRPLDLRVYWEAAQRVFIDGTEPYTRAAGQGLPFTYPPTALFLLRPLASLTLEQAANLMFALNIGLSLAVMLLLPRDLAWTGASPSAGSTRLARWGGLYIACFGGLYLTLYFHQVNLLILLCLWGYWRVLRRGGKAAGSGYCGIDPARRPEHEHASLGGLAAGAALALGSVAKPHYALLIASTIGCVRRVRPIGRGAWVLLGAGIASACLLGLSLSVAPASSWSAWLELVPGSTSYSQLPPGHSSIAAPWNRAIPGELARWLVPNKFTDPIVASPALATALGTAAGDRTRTRHRLGGIPVSARPRARRPNRFILERAVGRSSGCVPRGAQRGTTRRNSHSIPTSCNEAERRAGRALATVAAFTQRVR
jgi:hypothetical protein